MKEYKVFYGYRKKYIFGILLFPIALILKFIPKKNIILYGSMNGFDIVDNSKYKFINEYNSNSYFITKNIALLDKEILQNVKPIYSHSFKGILLQCIAKKVYFTHSIHDFVAPLVWGAKKCNLWHGVPIKNIDPETYFKLQKNIVVKFKKMIYKLFPYLYDVCCDEVYTPYKELVPIYESAFKLCGPIVKVKQQPRIKYAKKNTKTNRILYAPTYRKNKDINHVVHENGLLDKKLGQLLKQKNLKIVLRVHPIDATNLNKNMLSDHIILDNSGDLYESITSYCAVVSDFSSVYTDAESLQIPTYFLCNDYEEYKEEWGLYEYADIKIRENQNKKMIKIIEQL